MNRTVVAACAPPRRYTRVLAGLVMLIGAVVLPRPSLAQPAWTACGTGFFCTSSGLGIGTTTTPGYEVEVLGTQNTDGIRVNSPNATALVMNTNRGDGRNYAFGLNRWAAGDFMLAQGAAAGSDPFAGNAKLYITANGNMSLFGNVGVGQAAPDRPLVILGDYYQDADSKSQVLVKSSLPYNASPTAGIAFGTQYNSSAAVQFGASIQGYKENATNGDFSEAMRFTTQANGASPTTRMTILGNGNVGIGTTAPGSRLEVNGGGTNSGMLLYSGGSSNYTFLALGRTGAEAYVGMAGASGEFSPAALAGDLVIRSESKNIMFSTDASGATTQMYLKNGGNVGIGTVNPQSLLAVNGTITTKEVVVTNIGWSDYVFKPGYRLLPLSEVATYVKEHHHLPEIPSEAEVKEKGVSLGDMQAKLLAKIEELTLHMIQTDERLTQADRRNSRLEQQNRELWDRIARLEAEAGRNAAEAKHAQ